MMAAVSGYEPFNNVDGLFNDAMEDELDTAAGSPFAQQDISMTDGGDGELEGLLRAGQVNGEEDFDIHQLNEQDIDFDQRDKADDAEDYADISDDDLPDDEAVGTTAPQQSSSNELPMLLGIENSAMDEMDDLFGDTSSPVNEYHVPPVVSPPLDEDQKSEDDLASEHGEGDLLSAGKLQTEGEDEDDPMWRIQQALFAVSGQGQAPATEQENIQEWLKLEFPSYKKDENPFFTRLFPAKALKWTGKIPLRPPKSIHPTKVNLELEQDQKALFNSAAAPPTHAWARDNGVVVVDVPSQLSVEEESADESDTNETLPGGMTMQDLSYLCADYETLSAIAGSDSEADDLIRQIEDRDTAMFGDGDFPDCDRPLKKRRTGLNPHEIVSIYQYEMPSFDEPERLTKKLSGKVILDLNDPELLLEDVDLDTARSRGRPGEAMSGTKSVKELLKGRFSVSNDAEYDLLKQNHQHKVRGQLGNLSIDHSTPALRLQYPYYKVKLPISEARQFHRKKIDFKHLLFSFSKINKQKRKHMKGKSTKEIYHVTKDLTMGDNSTALLLEYSEEHPMMLSQTGMGNKIVNYYRRKTKDDTSRPKLEIGETSVLLPEDKSPFQQFGHVDPGETVSALYNSMYRAPIYEHDHKHQDFLITREHTGMHSSQFFLRNIDHLYVVGQELPSVVVPGPHSRFVTSAAKNRLKAISFRIARRKKSHRIRVEDVTRHFPDTTDMQNRQKMKEFMVFSKEHKEWEMKPGEMVPDEDSIQIVLRPEDVCLLESMQVGQQYLQDAGFAEDDEDDDDDDGKEKKGLTIEQELAPWKTTKNFLHATQGKAMLTLHGDGDPSGRGEAFSFIKTSMKGGFKAQGVSINETMGANDKKLGGHSYNVATQQKAYDDTIRVIWEKQKRNLELKEEHEDDGVEDGVDGQDDSFAGSFNARATPRSATNTPAPFRRRDDETATSFSKRSTTSQTQRFLRIRRRVRRSGKIVMEEHIETNPAVIKQYQKQKSIQETAQLQLDKLVPTGNADHDAKQRQRLEAELSRLERNRERRHQREKTKRKSGVDGDAGSPTGTAMSPDGEAQTPAGGKEVKATQRKCANCGQVGHIKTNKKLCPLLNGTIKQEDGFNNAAFMGAPPPSMH